MSNDMLSEGIRLLDKVIEVIKTNPFKLVLTVILGIIILFAVGYFQGWGQFLAPQHQPGISTATTTSEMIGIQIINTCTGNTKNCIGLEAKAAYYGN